MKELCGWGYIRYSPAANCHAGSEVSCIRFDTAGHTGNGIGEGTGNGAGNGTASGTCGHTGTNTGDGTLFKRTNNTKDKQDPKKNYQNGERKELSGTGRFHVPNDKDYSEPL
jgi:hypothetical protein